MALPTTLQRPILPYTPTNVSGPIDRYTALGDIAPKPQALEADINCIYQIVADTNTAVNGIAAGIIPGADQEANKNKIPTTDGESNISWTLVQNQHMDDNCCDTRNYLEGSITPDKLQPIPGGLLINRSVPDEAIIGMNGSKLTDLSVPDKAIIGMNGGKLTDLSVPDKAIIGMNGGKLTDLSVPDEAIIGMNGSKLTPGTVATAALAAKSVTIDKMNAEGAAANTFAKSTGVNGAVQFSALPFKGIKQIQSTVVNTSAKILNATNYTQFDTPLQVSITTQSPNSTILIYVSANVSAQNVNALIGYPQNVPAALFKNGSIWGNATGTPVGGQVGGFQQALVSEYYDVRNISGMILDTVAIAGTTNTYSLRAYNAAGSGYMVWLNIQAGGVTLQQGVAAISCIYAIEIGS